MSQVYHSNRKTNQHSRERIQHSCLSNIELSAIHGVSVKTISKWKHRESTEDNSSRPHAIEDPSEMREVIEDFFSQDFFRKV